MLDLDQFFKRNTYSGLTVYCREYFKNFILVVVADGSTDAMSVTSLVHSPRVVEMGAISLVNQTTPINKRLGQYR